MEHSQIDSDEFVKSDRRDGVRATADDVVERLRDIILTQGLVIVDDLAVIHADADERRVLVESRRRLADLKPGPAQLRSWTAHGMSRMPALVLTIDDTVATLHVDASRAELGGRRRDERHELDLELRGHPEDGGAGWAAPARNVSAGGALVPLDLEVASRHRLRLALPGAELALTGVVTRADRGTSAIGFIDLSPDLRRVLARALLRAALRPDADTFS